MSEPTVNPTRQLDKYREPTDAEKRSTDIKTPFLHDRRVRLKCSDGIALNASVQFEDGMDLRNVLRAVIAIEAGGVARVFLTRFNNEIGKVVYEEALALVG